ncbi:MAG: Uma2 family endonuclease [Chloroflexota bacterium]|nr:Uma2 family endonuclease [Chloroflexota bacterium]MDE2958828.1 Uma2 family endonuclease [Chloroflexota bacterium]
MTTAKPQALSTERNVFDGIYYPDEDGIPLPDGPEQEIHYDRVTPVLRAYLEQYYDVIVTGDTFLYYERGNRRAVVAPDCHITFGVNRDDILPHNSYFTWHLGRIPDFVLEIGSRSTARADLGRKRDLYASLGIGEYWRYDPSPDSRHYSEPLVGERLENGRYVRMEVAPGPDGMLRGHSPALGMDLCWDDGRLRFYDTIKGVWVPDYYDLREAHAEAEAARDTAEEARQTAEERLAEERAARRDAETRMAEMEAELSRLRGEAS